MTQKSTLLLSGLAPCLLLLCAACASAPTSRPSEEPGAAGANLSEAITAGPSSVEPTAAEPADKDPFLWLEDLTAESVLEWVRNRNARTERDIAQRAGFEELRDSLLAIYDSDERIAYVAKVGEYYYNFWRDEANPRGIWRRSTLEEYRKEEPSWEVLLDLDVLALEEDESWVWSGAHCLYPDHNRCLIRLSRGGTDARVSREFDLKALEFVEDGFAVPESKHHISWLDHDTVFVSTDFGESSLTDSGYPRIVKRWSRGTPLSEAETIFEVSTSDIRAAAWHDPTPGYERSFAQRSIASHESERYLIKAGDELVRIEVPNSASSHIFRDYLTVRPREDWQTPDRTYPAGSLLVISFDDFLAGARDFEILFEPTPQTSLLYWTATLNHIIINILDDVRGELFAFSRDESGWTREPLLDSPAFGTVWIRPVYPLDSNAYFMTVSDFLSPTTLYLGEVGSAPEKLKSLPSFFDAKGLVTSQHFVKSADGTRVPYFMVAPEDLELDGTSPLLLTGYGGFGLSSIPSYRSSVGRGWLEHGGVYVVANIRGGGEYGPQWHQAAIKENRPRSFEDFAAVAQDLIERGVTSPERLGISGGSNGGLLVGNMITTYPELFAAAVCSVPLLDMRRFHLLLAGAAWTGEYGNPDDPDDWEFIKTFSPYHNVREDERYPVVLFNTSTNDDRVHPGHARKMMALWESLGHDAYYFENIEGGHSAAANNRQTAFRQALIFEFLKMQLFPKESAMQLE